jgi:hypothetical protein
MNSNPFPAGTRVSVDTELGAELGTVLSHSNPAAGKMRYVVRFDDRTQSSWSPFQVHAV